MSKKKGKRAPAAAIARHGPTPERQRHNSIHLVDGPVADSRGEYGQPYRVTGMLDRMLARRDITASMRDAGELFQRHYRVAATGGVRATDWHNEIRCGSGSMSERVLRAREARDLALRALGRMGEPCWECAWNVLGEEMTLREWALREGWNGRPLREETAKGILVGTLGALAAHFRL